MIRRQGCESPRHGRMSHDRRRQFVPSVMRDALRGTSHTIRQHRVATSCDLYQSHRSIAARRLQSSTLVPSSRGPFHGCLKLRDCGGDLNETAPQWSRVQFLGERCCRVFGSGSCFAAESLAPTTARIRRADQSHTKAQPCAACGLFKSPCPSAQNVLRAEVHRLSKTFRKGPSILVRTRRFGAGQRGHAWIGPSGALARCSQGWIAVQTLASTNRPRCPTLSVAIVTTSPGPTARRA